MTIKELDSELSEIFQRRFALEGKLEHNIKEVSKLVIELSRITADKAVEAAVIRIRKLEDSIERGKFLVRKQKEDLKKVSMANIARQMCMTRAAVKYRYDNYGGKFL